MYKIVLKDSTVFNLKSIDEETEKHMIIVLETDLSHDAAVSNFTQNNLSYVQVLFNSSVINTYVNFKDVKESSVKDGIITVKLSKFDTKEIIIDLRKENDALTKANDALVVANVELEQRVKLTEDCILELSELVYATEDTEGDEEDGGIVMGE